VASKLGVSRQTVSGWKNHNENFSEAIDAAREDITAGTRMAAISTHGTIMRSIADLAFEGSPEDRRKAIALYFEVAVRPQDIERFNNPLSPEDTLIAGVLRPEPDDALNQDTRQ
jgi:hypothetical protein